MKGANRLFSWRGLGWFWAGILALAITGTALLQIIGPPINDSEHPATVRAATQQASPADAVAGSAHTLPVLPAGERQPSDDRISALLSRAETQIAQDRLELPPGDNATETLMEAFALVPR